MEQDFGLTILFVTHDLDEALYLAQRVIMLSASPGTIAEMVDVPLPYPRDQIETRSEPVYLELRERLYRSHGDGRSWPDGRTPHELRSCARCCETSRGSGVLLIALLLLLLAALRACMS